nr:DNA polymerase III subunit delta' [uncultured Oscillibacter sp.]
MSLFGLPDTDPIAARVREAATRGTLSHALLFTGSGHRLAAAKYAAAALECAAEGSRPCGVCPACRKVLGDIHPDVVTVRDDQHKNIAVDVVRAIRADAYIRPNEGRRKVYLFPDCALLTEQDQNVLLKIVEEGPPYAAFLFCAENGAAVLQTLRSRCVELKLHPAVEDAGEPSEAGEALCRAIGRRRHGAVAELAARMEKKRATREDLTAMLERARAAFAAALLLLYGRQPEEIDREIAPFLAKNLTKAQIMSTIELLQKYRGECAYNVGPGHVLGALAAELEGIL